MMSSTPTAIPQLGVRLTAAERVRLAREIVASAAPRGGVANEARFAHYLGDDSYTWHYTLT